MAGLALWNAWLYESLAEPSDREIMVLNLDTMEDCEEAISGVERKFLVHNPGETLRAFRLLFKHVPDAHFLVTVGDREREPSAAELAQGLELILKPAEHVRITMRRSDHRTLQLQLQQQRSAQNALAHAYQLLQEHAVVAGRESASAQDIQDFAEAQAAYRDGRHANARWKAAAIVRNTRARTVKEP